MNSYFLLWYYTKGLSAALSAYGNLLRYVLHRYYVLGLIRTFFAPWKRDVSLKDWRGFRPWKSLERLSENFFARFMGMIVRSVMLAVGFFLILLSVFGGGILFLSYLLSGVLIVCGAVLFMFSPLLGASLFMAGILGGLVAFVGYLFRYQEEPETLDIAILRKKRWFGRVIARLGLSKKDIPKEALRDTTQFLQLIAPLGIDEALYTETVLLERELAKRRDERARFWTWENLQKALPIGKGWSYAYTPHLDRFSLDLSRFDHTEYGKAELIGRKEELKVATVVLERANQNSLILVGEPGIGKKTFVHYLARLIRENFFQGTSLGNVRVLQFDLALAVSAAQSEGQEVDGYIRKLLEEAAYAGNILLFIENIDLFLGAHKEGGRNLGSLFSEFLSMPSFRMIATATPHSYHTLAQEDEQILKFLESIYLRETSETETLLVLVQHFERLESKRTVFSMKSFKAILASAEKIHWETPFPERALDLANEVLAYWQTTTESLITEKTVNDFVTLKTGVPVGSISEAEKEKLLTLEESLHVRVIGQDEAVKQVAEAMRKSRAGFGNAKRPLGSFIFLGPTGVGKTETVKAFAESYFGSEEKMIRLDMSEYQTPDAVTRLLGSRESNTPGYLVNAVKEAPFSILLLDEVEKAYPKVLDVFLQILDEGYVTDGFGEKANFRNMIIVATSNAGSALIRSSMAEGHDLETIRKAVLDHIVDTHIFRLEFLNRFDGVIFFKPLQNEEMLSVTRLKLEAFAKRLKKEKNITILFDEDVAAKIVEKGYEPEFGARSINRYIEDTIEDAVVKQVIAGEVAEGGVLSVTAAQL